MSNIKSFDRATLKSIRIEIDAALAQLAAKHGFSMKLGAVRFTETNFTGKVEASLSGEAPEVQRYRDMCGVYGLDAKMLGKNVHFAGEVFKVIGMKSGYKSVLAERGGRTYRIPVDRFRTGARLAA